MPTETPRASYRVSRDLRDRTTVVLNPVSSLHCVHAVIPSMPWLVMKTQETTQDAREAAMVLVRVDSGGNDAQPRELAENLRSRHRARRATPTERLRDALRAGSTKGFIVGTALFYTSIVFFTRLSFAVGVGVVATLVVANLVSRALALHAWERRDNLTLSVAYLIASVLLVCEIVILIAITFNPVLLAR